MKDKKKQNWKANVLLMLFSSAIVLIVGEIGFRAYINMKGPASISGSNLALTSDAYLDESDYLGKYTGFPKVEYHTYLEYWPLSSIKGKGYVTNEYGFRYAEDFPKAKKEDEIRIFVTGGSAAWGTGVRQEDAFTNIAEKLLQKDLTDKQVRVVNAGMGAYKSVQERILIENQLIQFEPDIVVMFSGWNDVGAGYSGMDIRDASDFLNYRDQLNSRPIINVMENRYPDWDDYGLKLHCALARVIWRIRYNNKVAVERAIAEHQLPPDQVISTLLNNIYMLSDLANRHNFKYFVYLQPSLYSTSKVLSDFEMKLLESHENKYVGYVEYHHRVYDLIRNELSRQAPHHNFYFEDADEAISKEAKSVFVDGVHMGSRGNSLLGIDLYQLIRKKLTKKDTTSVGQ